MNTTPPNMITRNIQIIKRYAICGQSQAHIARAYGITRARVNMIIQAWKAAGSHTVWLKRGDKTTTCDFGPNGRSS